MRLPPGVSKFPQQLRGYLRVYPTLFEVVLTASSLGKGPRLSQRTLLSRALQRPLCGFPQAGSSSHGPWPQSGCGALRTCPVATATCPADPHLNPTTVLSSSSRSLLGRSPLPSAPNQLSHSFEGPPRLAAPPRGPPSSPPADPLLPPSSSPFPTRSPLHFCSFPLPPARPRGQAQTA